MGMKLGLKKLFHGSNLRAYYAEFVGMFFFLFLTLGTVVSAASFDNGLDQPTSGNPFQYSSVLSIAMVFGFSIAVLVYAVGPFSGGHLNPAVTLGLLIFGQCDVLPGICYIISQILGAILGAAMVRGIWPDVAIEETKLGLNSVSPNMSTGSVFGAELWGTAALTFVVYGTAVSVRAQGNTALAPLAIGLTVFLAHAVLIPVSGCGINPARSIASAAVFGEGKDLWVYIIAPLIGGPVGAALHYLPLQFRNEPNDDSEGTTNLQVADEDLEGAEEQQEENGNNEDSAGNDKSSEDTLGKGSSDVTTV